MTESKSTRDYIRNWGRTAAREQTEQTFEIYNAGLNIGKIEIKWSESAGDFVWLCLPTFVGGWSFIHTSEADATDAIHTDYHKRMSEMNFGNWIYVMCKRHEMTCTGFAERLGVTRQTVHNWVKDNRQCSDLYIYNQIAALFADLEQMSQKDMLGHMSLLFKPR
jgi:DNA-binding XRE family transcriptional regulator